MSKILLLLFVFVSVSFSTPSLIFSMTEDSTYAAYKILDPTIAESDNLIIVPINGYFEIYSLEGVLVGSVKFPTEALSDYSGPDFYLSKNLFDEDDNWEIMAVRQRNSQSDKELAVIDDNGSILLTINGKYLTKINASMTGNKTYLSLARSDNSIRDTYLVYLCRSNITAISMSPNKTRTDLISSYYSPASRSININKPEAKAILTVFDLRGRIMQKNVLNSNKTEEQIPLPNLSTGNYIAHVSTNNDELKFLFTAK